MVSKALKARSFTAHEALWRGSVVRIYAIEAARGSEVVAVGALA